MTSARDIALHRLGFVFGRPQGGIQLTDRFDVELKARTPNDFHLNEFDQLLEDVQQMQSGGLELDHEIMTVEVFCALVERYSRDMPEAWSTLLGEWNKEERMNSAPAWRRALWRWIGL